MREEEDLDGQRQPYVEGDDGHKQDLARLAVGGAEDGVEVAQQEEDGKPESDADKDPIENRDG